MTKLSSVAPVHIAQLKVKLLDEAAALRKIGNTLENGTRIRRIKDG